MSDKMRLAMLVSGSGSTALAISQACKNGRLKRVEPVFVIASNGNPARTQNFQKLGVFNHRTLYPNEYESNEQFGAAILTICAEYGIDIIGQYGWLPKTPLNVVEEYLGRMINQHPGPLDPGYSDFGGKGMWGMRVHAARLLFVRTTHKEYWTEVAAQYVSPEYDCGTVIHRKRVKILDTDNPITLQQRALPIEHQTQIEALQMLSGEGTVQPQIQTERLILPRDETALADAKRVAGLLFPKG